MKNLNKLYIIIPIFILSSIIPFQGISQDVKVTPLKKIKRDNYLYVIGEQENKVYTGIMEEYFVVPDEKMKILKVDVDDQSVDDVMLHPKGKSDLLYVFFYNDQLHTVEYEDNTMSIKAYNEDLTVENEVKDTLFLSPLVFSYDLSSLFKNHLSSQSGKWRRNYIFSHNASSDGKLIIMLNNSYQTNTPRSLYFMITDSSFSSLAQHEIVISAEEEHLVIEDYMIANDGKVYLLAGAYEDDKFKKGPDVFRYYFYAYDPGQDKLQTIPLEMGDHFVTNLGLVADAEGSKPILAGLYNNSETLNTTGTVLFTKSSTGEMRERFTPFDKSVTDQIDTDENDRENVEEYAIRYLFVEDNNDITLFAEQYNRKLGVGVDISLFGGISPGLQLEDHYGDIIVARLHPEGDQEWTHVIEKEQESTDKNIMFNSFELAKDGSNYGLVFNEEVRNASDVVWVSLDENGAIKRKLLFKRREDDLRIAPMLAGTDKGKLFVPAIQDRDVLLISIGF